jgi:hypothetical protein
MNENKRYQNISQKLISLVLLVLKVCIFWFHVCSFNLIGILFNNYGANKSIPLPEAYLSKQPGTGQSNTWQTTRSNYKEFQYQH